VTFGIQGVKRFSYSLGRDFISSAVLRDNLLIMAGGTANPVGTGMLAAVWLHQPKQLLSTATEPGQKTPDESEASNGLKLYPNPAAGFVYLEWGNGGKNVQQVDLIDMNGQVLKSWSRPANGAKNIRLELGNLRPGSYVLTVRNSSGEMERRKLVIGD
jgi:hypothetical protein